MKYPAIIIAALSVLLPLASNAQDAPEAIGNYNGDTVCPADLPLTGICREKPAVQSAFQPCLETEAGCQRFMSNGEPITAHALTRVYPLGSPRLIDRDRLRAVLALGADINDRNDGNSNLLDRIILANAFNNRIVRFAQQTGDPGRIDDFLDDVEYLLDKGAIPKKTSTILMRRMVERDAIVASLGYDKARLANITARLDQLYLEQEALGLGVY